MPSLPPSDQRFRYLPGEPEDRVWGICLRDAGRVAIPPGADYPPRGHPRRYDFVWRDGRVLDEFRILFIDQGHGILETRRAGRRRVGTGQAFVVFPGEWHRYRPAPSGWRETWVGFSGDYATHLMRHFFSVDDPVLTPERPAEIDALMCGLVAAAGNLRRAGARSLLAVRVLELVSRLRRRRAPASPEHPRLETARMDILTRATERIDWPAMARHYGMGYGTFRRRFKEMTGRAPLDYQILVRLNHAAELLRRTSLTAREIAERLGYSYVHFFSRQFKGRFGCSPRDYRARPTGRQSRRHADSSRSSRGRWA